METKNKVIPWFFTVFIILSAILLLSGYFRTYDKDTVPPFQEASVPLTWTYEYNGTVMSPNQLKESVPVNQPYKMTALISLDQTQQADTLYLYPYHQSVSIYLDKELIYDLQADTNPYGRTPGYGVVFVPLGSSLEGKELTIFVSCPYSNFAGQILQTRLGERANLLYQILVKDILSYMTIAVLFCMGIAMIIISRLTNTLLKGGGYLYLGLFSIVFCFWAMAQLPLTELLINNRQGLLYMDYLNFFILGFCFFMFVRDRYQHTPKIVFGIISCCCLLLGFAGILGEFFFNYDFEDLLLYFHSLLVLGAIYAGITMYRQQKISRSAPKSITMNIGVTTVMLSFIIDLFCYYFYQSADVCRFSRIGLIIYDILLIYDIMKKYISAIKNNAEADFLKKIAYTDIMTNLENRRAYEMKIEELEQDVRSHNSSTPICIALCDLNHLKQINDTKGHAKGDYYIITASDIIKEVFSGSAHCYRIGGDEFAIISTSMSFDDFTHKLSTINQQLMDTHSSDGYQYSMAIGAKIYQSAVHKNIQEVIQAADQEMYKNKSQFREN